MITNLKNPCIGDRFLLLKNGIKILKIIINKFPIENNCNSKGLKRCSNGKIIFNYEKNKKLLKKQKNKDSNRWLDRHLNDEYVIKSKIGRFSIKIFI